MVWELISKSGELQYNAIVVTLAELIIEGIAEELEESSLMRWEILCQTFV
jgi:hypothetical protein